MANDDLISRSALIQRLAYYSDHSYGDAEYAYGVATREVLNTPAVDAAPVVHAKWEIIHGMINPKYQGRKRCSRCGDISPSDMCCREMLTDYCPNCGAKMDAKEE